MITEESSRYDHLERMSLTDLLHSINAEDQKVPNAVKEAIPQIERLAAAVIEKMEDGGRLFYIGAGTSGRLGVVDASEIPPTFGMPHDRVVALIAGGDQAIRRAVEGAEDDEEQAWIDLQMHGISNRDFLLGIAASGRTPYVVGALRQARQQGIQTGCITCNPQSQVSKHADFPVEIVVGPEFVTGSTRMKSGTAQKLALNMISTSVMIALGRVKGNKMVDMQLTNEKLVDRGIRMVMEELGVNRDEAARLLTKHGSVREAVDKYRQ